MGANASLGCGSASDPSHVWRAHVHRNLLGEAPKFLAALKVAEKLAKCDATGLIQGETGTGKEVIARAVHYTGTRAHGPFVPVNCGAIPDALVESELFGHVRGAFTDARENQIGLVAQAEGGTLFLDEIEALSARAQVVLMRFLQDHEYRQVGGRSLQRANVRVLSATNVDLGELVRIGSWRTDLMFRLKVISISLPALRERGDDVLMLADFFLRQFAERYNERCKQLDADTQRLFLRYAWPGNVRELENLIHREFLLSDSALIRVTDHALTAQQTRCERPADRRFREAKRIAIAEFERTYLEDLLERTNGNITEAARICGKERSALGKLVRKHGLLAHYG